MAGPDDVSAVADLFDRGVVDPAHVVAIVAQTEGDGYARGYSALSLQLLLAERLALSKAEISGRIPMLMIGGTAGLMSPHFTLLVNKPADRTTGNGEHRLAIGVTSTRTLQPEECGTVAQIELVADGVRRAMTAAAIRSADDVVCVTMKCPQMTARRMEDARPRAGARWSTPIRWWRARCAAVPRPEVPPWRSADPASRISDAIVGRRSDLYTERGSASRGSEQVAVRIVVLGKVARSAGRLRRGARRHAASTRPRGARAAFRAAGLRWTRASSFGGQAQGRGGVRQCRRRLSADLRRSPSHHALRRLPGAVFRPHRQGGRPRQCLSRHRQDTLVLETQEPSTRAGQVRSPLRHRQSRVKRLGPHANHLQPHVAHRGQSDRLRPAAALLTGKPPAGP